jgi:hypothetical protein
MNRKVREHVIEKANACCDLVLTASVQLKLDGQLRFVCLT